MSEQSLSLLQDFSVIKLTGQDAKSFLQGQVTCDTNKLTKDNWLGGCHCNAKGKMWSSFLCLNRDDALYLVLTKESAEISLAELNKYGVFAKTDITDDTENWFIYGSSNQVEGEETLELAPNHFLVLSKQELAAGESPSVWWQKEILSGRAHTYQATSGEYVPQMLNLQVLDYISFNKGCYMGQEMVARMRYLGKNKRALFIAQSDTEFALEIGQDIYIEIGANRRSGGKVINKVTTNGKTIAQLVMSKDTEVGSNIYLNQEGPESMQLTALPYSLDEN